MKKPSMFLFPIIFMLSILALIFIATVLLTKLTIRYALAKNILDRPNHRSSHARPVPKGGGIAIYLVFTAVLIGLKMGSAIGTREFLALFTGGLIVVVIGWIDDRQDLSPAVRSLAYLFAAAMGIYWAGGFYAAYLADVQFDLGFTGNLIALFALAWLINLYNFMDGIDGLAAIETLSTAFMAGIFFVLAGQVPWAFLCFSLAAVAAGFLVMNWPPASIFMGDAGSCFIGFNFGILALVGGKVGIPIEIWIILLSVFIVDSSLTLMRRFVAGEPWYSAHRSHAYQRLVQLGTSHRAVSLGVLTINLCLLGPVAYFAYRFTELAFSLMLIVITALSVLWFVVERQYKNKSAQAHV